MIFIDLASFLLNGTTRCIVCHQTTYSSRWAVLCQTIVQPAIGQWCAMTHIETKSEDSEATLIEKELKRAKENNITILCGGPTGSGKSSLLNSVTPALFKVDESLTCCTLEPGKETYMLNGTEVDTPGLECDLETDQAFSHNLGLNALVNLNSADSSRF